MAAIPDGPSSRSYGHGPWRGLLRTTVRWWYSLLGNTLTTNERCCTPPDDDDDDEADEAVEDGDEEEDHPGEGESEAAPDLSVGAFDGVSIGCTSEATRGCPHGLADSSVSANSSYCSGLRCTNAFAMTVLDAMHTNELLSASFLNSSALPYRSSTPSTDRRSAREAGGGRTLMKRER